MTSTSDILYKNYVPYNKLKLCSTPMVGIGKGIAYSKVFPFCERFFLKDGTDFTVKIGIISILYL